MWFYSAYHRETFIERPTVVSILVLIFDLFLCTCLFSSLPVDILSIFIFISYSRQRVSIVLQCAQTVTILQWAAMLSHNSSSLPHIPTNATPSLADLWQRMPLLALCLSLPYYCFDGLDFPCVYICINMPCTFCGWISILVYIYLQVFISWH
jgi:hypothetical protein